MQVRRDFILVKPIEEELQNGLYIPPVFKKAGETSVVGTVEFCGPRASVKKGDTVVVGKWSGDEIIVNGVKLLAMKARSIFAIK